MSSATRLFSQLLTLPEPQDIEHSSCRRGLLRLCCKARRQACLLGVLHPHAEGRQTSRAPAPAAAPPAAPGCRACPSPAATACSAGLQARWLCMSPTACQLRGGPAGSPLCTVRSCGLVDISRICPCVGPGALVSTRTPTRPIVPYHVGHACWARKYPHPMQLPEHWRRGQAPVFSSSREARDSCRPCTSSSRSPSLACSSSIR